MIVGLIAALLLQGDVPAAAETLAAPMPPGFKVGFTQAAAGQTIEERVPAAETVEAWSRMVTIQRFAGFARIGPHAFLDRLDAMMAQACPGAVAAPIRDATVAGRPEATARVDCPRNPGTGRPETMFARAIGGAADLHLVQYAFRAVPGRAEERDATAYLASVRLCGAGSACPAER